MTVIERSWNIAGISHINDTWVGRPSVLKWQQVHLGDSKSVRDGVQHKLSCSYIKSSVAAN